MRFKVSKGQKASPGGQALVSGQEENRKEKSRKQWKKDIVSCIYCLRDLEEECPWHGLSLNADRTSVLWTPYEHVYTVLEMRSPRAQEICRVVCPEASLLGLNVCVLTWSSLCGRVCPHHPSSTPSCQVPGQIGLAPPPMTSFYPNYLFKGPISKCSHILRDQKLGFLHMNSAKKTPKICIFNTCP